MSREIRIPAETVRLWRIRAGAVAAVIEIILLRFCRLTLWMLLPAGIIAAAALVLILWFIPRHLESYGIIADIRAITVKRGFIFKAEHILPQPRMIYASAYSSPLARKMRLSGVILRAARGILIIPELRKKDAERLFAAASGERI